MNGSETKIYEAVINLNEKITAIKVDVAAIKTTQKINHGQNQLDIKEYKKTSNGFIKLKTQVFYQWFFLGAVFIGILTLALRGIQ